MKNGKFSSEVSSKERAALSAIFGDNLLFGRRGTQDLQLVSEQIPVAKKLTSVEFLGNRQNHHQKIWGHGRQLLAMS